MSDFYNKYPYTDFHELNLDWVIERVKKLTEDWLATQEAWNNTQEQWRELYNYVHDYFDNLDVQDEINNKINQMILDGTFMTVVAPTINQTVVDATTTWLADHITQPTTPAVDTSLSIAGAAADAKVTGDYIFNQCLKGLSMNSYVTNAADLTTDASSDMDKLKPNIMAEVLNISMTNAPVSPMSGYIISIQTTNGSSNLGDIQIHLKTNGEMYQRTRFAANTFTPWQFISPYSMHSVKGSTYVSSLTSYTSDSSNDADKLNANMMIGLLSCNALNLPVTPCTGLLTQINTMTGEDYGKVQTLYTSTNIYIRTCYSYDGTWNAWFRMPTDHLAGASTYRASLAGFTTDGTNDADKLKPYVMVGLLNSTASNLPLTNGFILSISATENGTYGNVQFFLASNNKVFMRSNFSYDGTYTAWRELTEYYTKADYTKTFRNIAALGDSITAGTMPDMQGNFYRDFDYSWPSLLFTNATIQDCSQSGANAKTFFTDAALNARLAALDSKTEAVFVYLGTNGITDATMGDTTDIVANWNDTPTETYYGWYSKLFKAIRHYTNQYCPIVIINLRAANTTFIERNEMLAACASACGCLYADQNTYPASALYYLLSQNNDGTHFTSAGYAGVAEAFKWIINDTVQNNPASFNKTSLILGS